MSKPKWKHSKYSKLYCIHLFLESLVRIYNVVARQFICIYIAEIEKLLFIDFLRILNKVFQINNLCYSCK